MPHGVCSGVGRLHLAGSSRSADCLLLNPPLPTPVFRVVWIGALTGVAISIAIGVVFICLFYVAGEKIFTGNSQVSVCLCKFCTLEERCWALFLRTCAAWQALKQQAERGQPAGIRFWQPAERSSPSISESIV